ncbi:hypothetical protein [Megalodesulfovibrio paquesii]
MEQAHRLATAPAEASLPNASGPRASGSPAHQGPGLVAWLRLVGCLLAIVLFMFVVGPWLRRQIPEAQALADFIDSTGMQSNMIYYTDVPETAWAEQNARASIKYRPVGPQPDSQ